jgi:exonuclease SbcD
VKILHTADWHVGRTIRGRSRVPEHEAVLAEIARLAAAESVDLILVVGDVFDTSAPTPEAERIAYQALLELAGTGATVVVLSGNHDNERRLQAVAPLAELGNIVVRASFAPADAGGVVSGVTAAGEPWRVATVPFLSQRWVVRAADLLALDADQHAGQYSARVGALVAALTAGFTPDAVNLVAAHLHIAGGRLGGGERLAHTIFDYAVSPAAFPAAAHYVALGHLHRAQAIPGPCPMHYSGSPLQLDFGETADRKSVTLVTASPGRPAVVRPVPLAEGRRLRTLRGTLEELSAGSAAGGEAGSAADGEAGSAAGGEAGSAAGGEAGSAARGEAGSAAGGDFSDDWLKVVVTQAPALGLADEVRARWPNAVDVIVEDPLSVPAGSATRAPARADRRGRSPQDLFAEYLESRSASDDRVAALFDRLLEEVVTEVAG